MSDRETNIKYCDRDPYDRDSGDILFLYPKDSIKNDIELEYYRYWCKISSKLAHSQTLIRFYKDFISGKNQLNTEAYYQAQLNIEKSNVKLYENLLSRLEMTAPIKNMLQRKRKPNEIITLRYSNIMFPNTPYSDFFLTNEDVMLIKTVIEEKIDIPKQNNKTNIKINESQKRPIKLLILPFVLILIFLLSIFDMPYGFYTFARIAIFALSLVFLYILYNHNEDFSLKFIPIIVIAILWNPIFPIYLDKETWVVLDIVAIITEIIVSILSIKKR